MLRAVLALAVALSVLLVGCATEVKLLTASGPLEVSAGNHGLAAGLLLPDGKSGTVLRVEEEGFTYPFSKADGSLDYAQTAPFLKPADGPIPVSVPITWPEGYTSRRTLSGQIEVLNTEGELVATTGLRYFCEQTTRGAWVGCEPTGD